ncbi:hypothetical protein EV121DRAFT_268523 [Schizophyllum commune]
MLRARSQGRLRRGLLIDLDSATDIHGPQRISVAGQHLGTLPFMSFTLLLCPTAPHLPIHDLESFLYVLMWICTSYAGPMSARQPGFDPYQSPMGRWFSGDPTTVGKLKRDIMFQSPEGFRAFLDDTFDPYFDGLKDCVCEIRHAILMTDEGATHKDILDILEVHMRAQQPSDTHHRPPPSGNSDVARIIVPSSVEVSEDERDARADDEEDDEELEEADVESDSGRSSGSASCQMVVNTMQSRDGHAMAVSLRDLGRGNRHPFLSSSTMAETRTTIAQNDNAGDMGIKHPMPPQSSSDNDDSALRFPFRVPESIIQRTPRQQRPSSYPTAVTNGFASREDPLGTNALMTHGNLDATIQNMFKGSIIWQAGHITTGLIPTRPLPATPSTMLKEMAKAKLYDTVTKRWIGDDVPNFEAQTQEDRIANFLQSIADFIRSHWGTEDTDQSRRWTAEFHGAQVAQSGVMNRHPDISLVDGPGCKHVLMNVEHKSSESLMYEAVGQLHDSALNCMPVQDTRIHFSGLAIAGTKFRVVVHHRSGCVVSSSEDIHTNAVVLVRLLAGLTLFSKDQLGCDPHVEERGGKRFVTVNGVEYEILEVLSTDKTNVWHDTSRAHKESDFYAAAAEADVKGIPTIVDEEVVCWPTGGIISTHQLVKTLCGGKKDILKSMEDREYRRIVMKGYGALLSDFSSKLELLCAMRDYVITHRSLCTEADIMHADIYDGNLVLKGGDPSLGIRCGILIDLDYAFFREQGHATFAACDILCHPNVFPHEIWHDLESLLYVLIWFCSVYTGPEIRLREFDVRKSPLGEWLEGSDSVIGAQKAKTMRLQHEPYDRMILDNFLSSVIDPYFADLKECIREWRAIVMRRGPNPPTHDEVLEVLQRYIEKVQEQGMTMPSEPAVQVAPSVAPSATSAVPMAATTSPAPVVCRTTVSAPVPLGPARQSSRKRKVEARDASPVEERANTSIKCSGCTVEFPVDSEDIVRSARIDAEDAEDASSRTPKAKRHHQRVIWEIREPGFDPYQFPMGQWFSGDPATVGKLKRDIMFKPEKEFRAFLDDTFDPYFDDLKDYVCEIRQAILLTDEGATHKDVVNILEVHARAQQPPDERYRPALWDRREEPPSWESRAEWIVGMVDV